MQCNIFEISDLRSAVHTNLQACVKLFYLLDKDKSTEFVRFPKTTFGVCSSAPAHLEKRRVVVFPCRECICSMLFQTHTFVDGPIPLFTTQAQSEQRPKLTSHRHAISHHSTDMPVKVSTTDMPPPSQQGNTRNLMFGHKGHCGLAAVGGGHISWGDFNWHVGGVVGNGTPVRVACQFGEGRG